MLSAYIRIAAFAAISVASWWWADVLPSILGMIVVVLLHLALPLFSYRMARAHSTCEGFVAGPGLVLIAYLVLLIRMMLDIGGDHGGWLAWLVAGFYAVLCGAYAAYLVGVTVLLHRLFDAPDDDD